MNYGRAPEPVGDVRSSQVTNQMPSPDRTHAASNSWHSNVGNVGGGISSSGSLRSIQEHGAPFDLNQRDYRNSTFTRMAARRQSTMSRLGSRFLPNSVIRGLLSSEEETPAEGLAHRHGIVSRSIPRSETVHGSSRFSPFSSLGSRGITRRRSTRSTYFVPRGDSTLASDGSNTLHRDSNDRVSDRTGGTRRRSARLHRVRNSLSNPISHMFAPSSSGVSSQDTRNQERPPSHSMSGVGNDIHSAFPGSMDPRMDFDEPLHELDSVEPAVRNTRPLTPIPPQAGTLQFPGFLRTRASRALRREEQTPLSRVLQIAAAAIAAQLSGNTGPSVPNIQALGNDSLDASFENFIQSLQQSTFGQANNPTLNSTPGDTGSPPTTNLMRVFRFPNPGSPNGSRTPGTGADGMDVDGAEEGFAAEGRTVTLVLVGVRSVPSNSDTGGDQANADTGLDTLLPLPFLHPGNAPRREESMSSLPRTDGRVRFPAGHHPTAGLNEPSANPEVANEAGIPVHSRRPSDSGIHATASSLPTVLSESPPGPNPPPSTPAEPGLSAVSSGASTPNRRPSSASAMPLNPLPHLHEYQSMRPMVEPAEHSAPPNAARQRRRSDSEYARHRDLGSGAVRRNGVVEPDDATPPGGRSWLIYVVGTNLSENHPAFATPSLFTDVGPKTRANCYKLTVIQNPTYEDMVLLSNVLGPVKPPVATRDDLNLAGGLYRLMEYAGSLVAEALEGTGTIQIPDGDRCLICLSEYEAAEEVRQLGDCKHVYHRECIDQVC